MSHARRIPKRLLVAALAVAVPAAVALIIPTYAATASTTAPTATTAAAAVKVYVAGDSTASIYEAARAPRTGWGQALPVFLTSDATVVDVAQSGASSKSFIDAGRLDIILSSIQSGDYLLISFGHNDEKEDAERHTDAATTYKEYLTRYIDGARAKGATPVLVTPVERRRFDSAGVATESHGAYPAAMRELAAAQGVPLIDLTALSLKLFNSAGVEGTKSYFLFLAAGQNANYPDGIEDNTHFQAHGAIEIARLIAQELNTQAILPAEDFQRLTTADIPDTTITWPATLPY